MRVARTAVIFLVFAGALWLLRRELMHYDFAEIRNAIGRIPARRIGLALALMVVNYLVLVGFDWLAIREIGRALPLRRVALASFVGFAISYNFGALLGGTSVRYRLYSSWGLSAVEILRLVLMLGITFWFGVLALAGVLFVVDPFPIPAGLVASGVSLPFETVRPLGYALLAFTVVYLAIVVFWRRPIRFRGFQVMIPSVSTSLLQLLVSGGDLLVAGSVLFVLLPPEFGLSYLEFTGIYVLAVVAVILSHVPAGVAVFEVVILNLVQDEWKGEVLAALVLFRAIYYLLPLLLAAALLGAYELRLRWKGGSGQ